MQGKVYVNTLVFSVVSAVLALMLLVLLVWGPSQVRDFAFLVVTIELGLVAVMVTSIVRIWLYERSLEKDARNIQKNLMVVDTCPDYWTSDQTPTGKVCRNTYSVPRPPIGKNVQYTFTGAGAPTQINLREVSKQKLPDLCKKISTSFKNVAWTDLKGACVSYSSLSS